MDELLDMIATDKSASDISDSIKDTLYAKAAERINSQRPDVAASIFDPTIEDSENTKIGIKGCVTESSLDVVESKNVMKMKDRIVEPVKADCSKDGPGKNNFNLNHDSLNNFDALRTAAPETKPNNGGKYSFKYRQKIDETKHTNLVKVRKRRRPS